MTALWGLSLVGCGRGDGIERVRVFGKVTFQNQPLEVGQIRFIPNPGTKGPVTIEKFEHGEYRTDTSMGVPVGSHRVEILAYTTKDYENWPEGPGVPPVPQILPEKFNTKSQLTVEFSSGANKVEQDFHLTR